MTRWLPCFGHDVHGGSPCLVECTLLQQNEQLYILKSEKIQTTAGSKILETNYEKQRKMIMGEGLVFAISMVLGTYFIYKSNIREMNLSRRQSNFYCRFHTNLNRPLPQLIWGSRHLKKNTVTGKIVEVANMALKESRRLENLISPFLLQQKLNTATCQRKKDSIWLISFINCQISITVVILINQFLQISG